MMSSSEIMDRWVSADKMLTLEKKDNLLFIVTGRITLCIKIEGLYFIQFNDEYSLSHLDPMPAITLLSKGEAKEVAEFLEFGL